jgi:hypothetical protein
MRKNATGCQSWPLTTGNNDNPSLTQGSPTSFFCNTVPDRAPGGLAYYLPEVLLTITGNVVQSGTAGVAIAYDVLRQCIIDSIDWITAWHGTVVSANHVKGKWLPIVEFVSGGYGYATRQPEIIQAAAGTYPFEMTVKIPASSADIGNLGSNTSQLALLFQTSQIKVNVASSTVISGISPGATLTSLAARCSATLEPSPELILGTPIEWIMEQTVAGASSPQVQIKGFGTDTLLQGVENKGGVLWLGELTNVNNQGGVFAAETVTNFSFPWGNQQQTYHPQALISAMITGLPNGKPMVFPTSVAGGDGEGNSFPYGAVTSNQSTTTSTLMTAKGLLAWIMRQANQDAQLTNCQTADSDQSYFLGLNTTFSAGSHLILGAYARRFTRDMRMNWVGQVSKGGANSLAAHVLGPAWQGAVSKALANDLRQRVPRTRHVTTPDQMTYLPFQLAA